MKQYTYILFSVILICFSSCKENENVSFGTVCYYPSFLWVDSQLFPVTKTLFFDFSQDAKDYNSYAEFQFVDNQDKAISTDVMQIVIDDKECSDNRFRISSDITSKELTFKFSPNAKNGKHQGYLKLVSHQLDRLDSQLLTADQQVDAFQWTLNYDKRMNPLAKVLMWICILMVSTLLIWFLLIKPLKYPRFPKFRKMVLVKKDGKIVSQFSVNFKGARRVIFSDRKQHQGILNKFFTGRIDTIINPLFEEPITFMPRRPRRAIVKGKGYLFNPNPIPQSGGAEISLPSKKIIITLK